MLVMRPALSYVVFTLPRYVVWVELVPNSVRILRRAARLAEFQYSGRQPDAATATAVASGCVAGVTSIKSVRRPAYLYSVRALIT
jgi:hypothetical protein